MIIQLSAIVEAFIFYTLNAESDVNSSHSTTFKTKLLHTIVIWYSVISVNYFFRHCGIPRFSYYSLKFILALHIIIFNFV